MQTRNIERLKELQREKRRQLYQKKKVKFKAKQKKMKMEAREQKLAEKKAAQAEKDALLWNDITTAAQIEPVSL